MVNFALYVKRRSCAPCFSRQLKRITSSDQLTGESLSACKHLVEEAFVGPVGVIWSTKADQVTSKLVLFSKHQPHSAVTPPITTTLAKHRMSTPSNTGQASNSATHDMPMPKFKQYVPAGMATAASTTTPSLTSTSHTTSSSNTTSNATATAAPSAFPHPAYHQPLIQSTSQRKRKRKPRLFAKDVENLLFALGDMPALTDGTVAALEDVLVEYLVDLCHKFQGYAHSQGRTRVKMNDLVFALRNDPLKLARLQYIVEQNDRIQRAKKMFEAKTGNFNENGGISADRKTRMDQDSDDDMDDVDDDEEVVRPIDTKKKKRKGKEHT